MGPEESDRTKKHSQEKVLRAFLEHVTGSHPAAKRTSQPPATERTGDTESGRSSPAEAGGRAPRTPSTPPRPSPRPLHPPAGTPPRVASRPSDRPAEPASRERYPTGSMAARRASLPYAVTSGPEPGAAAQRRDSAAMRRMLPRDPDISRTPTEIRPSPHEGVPAARPAVGSSSTAGPAALVVPPPTAPSGAAASPVAGAIGVGTVLDDKYRLVRLLGKGGVGEVYEAVHELIGLRVAVKLIRFEYASNAELNQRFLQEARAAAAVGHPGIVQIHDVGRTPDGRTYLVMEYLDGEDLEKQLGRERRLRLDETADILCDVLDALAAAHAKGIIHRDMKPENVFLVPGRHGERVTKLLDFGIARLNDEVQTATRLTRPGSVMGTPYYMCPEQARGDQHVDAGVDIYAVGVMLYEMLTGELPFSGNTYNEVLSKVLAQPFPSLRAKRDDVPAEVEGIVFRATARERSARYATALEFAEALAPFRAGRMPAPGPAAERRSPTAETPLPTTSRPSLPPRPAAAGPDDAIDELASPAGAAAPTLGSEPPAARAPGSAAPGAAPAASPVGPRRRWKLWVALAATLAVLVAATVLGLRGSGRAAGRPAAGGSAEAGLAGAPEARIRVTGAPAGAEVRFDGRPVGAEFRVPLSADEHSVEVIVPGRPSVVRAIRPTADLVLDVAAAFAADNPGPPSP